MPDEDDALDDEAEVLDALEEDAELLDDASLLEEAAMVATSLDDTDAKEETLDELGGAPPLPPTDDEDGWGAPPAPDVAPERSRSERAPHPITKSTEATASARASRRSSGRISAPG